MIYKPILPPPAGRIEGGSQGCTQGGKCDLSQRVSVTSQDELGEMAEAGELQLEIQSLDVDKAVRDAVGWVRGAAREKGVALSADLPDQLSPIAGDAHRLTQVLLNLLSNAVRHTPSDGRITVLVRQIGGEEVQVTVQDTGEGIPSGELSRVFERFYCVDHARNRDAGGSGLGLTIACSLIDAHGGRIWAHSIKGRGSEFTFVLPPVLGA